MRLSNKIHEGGGHLGCHACVTIVRMIHIRMSRMRDNRLRASARASRIRDIRPLSVKKTLRMGFFQKIEFDAWLISSTSLRPIARFVVEIQRFVCDCTTPPIIEKLQSNGVAMHTYGVSAYYA